MNSQSRLQQLQGKTVVLTGASRGLGSEMSALFVQQGLNIIGVARNPLQLAQWAKRTQGFGVQAEGIAFDLNDTDRLPELVEQIEQCSNRFGAGGKVDILVNNAGVEIYRAFRDYTLAEIETVIRVNLLAAMGLTRLLLPHLSEQGHIVNIASLAGKKGHPYDSAYAASKAGLLMWNNSLRQELADSRLSVSVICPGYVVDQGMLADTGVNAPLLAGRSRARTVATAVLKSIIHRRAEVIVNQDPITEVVTRGLLALEQIFPRLADLSNDWLGITRLNKQRVTPSAFIKNASTKKDRMKKISFAIYDMGAGHRSTANALKDVIESRNLPWDVEIVEVLKDVCNTTFSQDFYNRWILKRKWAKLINDPISVPIFKARIRLMHRIWRRQLVQYWRSQQPDIVVSLMPLLNRVLYESVSRALPDTPFITSVTDFADCPEHFWIEPQDQLMICPSNRVVQQAKDLGYPDESLFRTSGVVIHPRYDKPVEVDPEAKRQQLGLHPDLPTGLVCFGSHGSQDMLEIAQQLNRSAEALQLIFVCGRNEKLAEQLRQLPTRYAKRVEGFTRELPTYMKTADFFIGKPGSVGVSEAIALGLPVITECHPVMTLLQERATADWLADNGFGIVVPTFKQVNQAVSELLEPDKFAQIQDQISRYRNRAAFEVVDILENILDKQQIPPPTLTKSMSQLLLF
ncbi:MAG: SDR family NAD(P)-dependent oxidoreductase [Cyanobacteria bacterium J06560_6]